MTAARQGAVDPKTTYEFARSLLMSEGLLLPTPDEIARVSSATEAAYRCHVWLMSEARLNNYKFEKPKHRGDAMDFSYLPYLADPDVRFLTHDSRIKKRMGDCPQSDQIIVLPNLEKPARG